MNEGSYGGRYGKDAMDSVDNLMANTRNNPIEELDLRFPLRCDQYELRPEPAAPGRGAAAIGIIRRNRFLVDGIYSCEGDRQTDPPRGIFGGWDGLVASCRKNPDTAARGGDAREGDRHRVRGRASSSSSASRTQPGTAIRSSRPAMVREDVLDDFTTSSSPATPTAWCSSTSGRSRSTRTQPPACVTSYGSARDCTPCRVLAERGTSRTSAPSSPAGNAQFGMA